MYKFISERLEVARTSCSFYRAVGFRHSSKAGCPTLQPSSLPCTLCLHPAGCSPCSHPLPYAPRRCCRAPRTTSGRATR